MRGFLESLTSAHAIGWAEYTGESPSHIVAMLDSEILGFAHANAARADLQYAAEAEGLRAGGFLIIFNRPLSAAEQEHVFIRVIGAPEPLARLPELRRPRLPVYPVFIVGSPRSGTSILTRALQAIGYAGYYEGNFLSLLFRLAMDVEAHFKDFGSTAPEVLIAHIDKNGLKARLAGVLRNLVENLYQGQAWLDKTGNPEIIAAIPLLRALWPGSVFIFAKRRAIENIASRVQKFPEKDFKYHCVDWSRNMATWRHIRTTQEGLQYREIDQWDIANAPQATAESIAAFLQLPPEMVSRIAGIFTHERPQQTAEGTASRTLTIGETGWSIAEQEIFRKFCGTEMRANQYTVDERYRRPAEAAVPD